MAAVYPDARYAFRVYCTIYRLRKDGERLPADAVRATGTVARLRYERHALGQPTYVATMLDVVTGEAISQLGTANIKLVDEGIKIAGWEGYPGRVQLWWCVPLTPEQNTELKATLARIRPAP